MSTASLTQPEHYLEPTAGRVLRFWWAWTWRWLLLVTGCFVVIAMPLNLFLNLFGPSATTLRVFGLLTGFSLGCLSQVSALWYVLDKDFSDFRVRLQEAETLFEGSDPQFDAPALKHALKVWWAWFWRTQLISIPGSFIGGIFVGIAGTIVGITPAGIQLTAGGLALLVSLVVSIWMFGYAIRKDYGSFRLRLLP